MSTFRTGDAVVTCKDIGGVMRPSIPAGSPGIVVDSPWLGQARVQFTIEGMFSGRRTETVTVSDDEVR